MAQDIFSVVLTYLTTFPYNVIAVGLVLAYVVYEIYVRRFKGETQFQIEDFRDTVYTNYKKLLKQFGIEIDAMLTKGIEPLGKITKFYRYQGKITSGYPKEYGSPKTTDEKEVDLWIFQIGSESIFSWLLGSSVDYVILPDEHLESYNKEKKQINLKPKVSLVPYGGVFISGKEAEAFVNEVSFRRSVEEIMTHTQNYPRKVAYIELAHAKEIERLRQDVATKREGYDAYRKSVLGAGKDLEDETEE